MVKIQSLAIGGKRPIGVSRCRAEPQKTNTKRVPPPPPPPPPPPSFKNMRRRQEANRRDTLFAVVGTVGMGVAFLVMADVVKGPVDRGEVYRPNTRMKRNEKGQPFVQGSDGDWYLLKASSLEAGVVYMRDRLGRVYKLVVDNRVQVDLSDDNVVMDIFGDGQWESAVQQLMTQSGTEVVITEDVFMKST